MRTSSNSAIGVGAVIPIPNVRVIGSDLSYSATSSAVRINQTGSYLFIWSLLSSRPTGTSSEQNGIVVTLENLAGNTQYAFSGKTPDTSSAQFNNTVVGATVVALSSGEQVVLRNRSNGSIILAAATGSTNNSFAGSLTVVRVG